MDYGLSKGFVAVPEQLAGGDGGSPHRVEGLFLLTEARAK